VVDKKIGKVVSMQQLPQQHRMPMQRAFAMDEAQSPYSEGQMNISASVQVEFELRD
jgi:uncharacterized protein YggE